MDIALTILRPVAEMLTVHLTQKLRYLTSCTKYIKVMGDKMLVLNATSNDVINHIDANNIMSSETPGHVRLWLEDVEKVKNEVQRIQSNDIGYSNIKRRYQVGMDAFNTAKRIENLIEHNPGTLWPRIPRAAIGNVYSNQVSTSEPARSSPSRGDTQSDFISRHKPFKQSLKFLRQDDKTQVIALCGMGGVGKTTMMERLRDEAKSKKMFNQIVKAVIGRNYNMFSVQSAIADYIGVPLVEQSEAARADRLRERFEHILKTENKILVILDDVWEKIELKYIGLVSPLPNGVKLLFTSRDENVCTKIAADVPAVIEVVKVEALVEPEARNLFSLITEVSEGVDRDLYEIGCDIVKKCGYLPLAIKLIAATLIHKEKAKWRRTLDSLKRKDLSEDLKGIIEISYENLGEDEREILLLCGLHLEDSNIPIEDLTRYAWGLRLFKKVYILRDVRDKTEDCVSNLKSANLLMDSDDGKIGCVKMHDLVLAFVVDRVSKGEDAWIIDHNDDSNWSKVTMSESCKKISLLCSGRSKFLVDFKFPNLSLLKLIGVNETVKFPIDFYVEMKKLEVIGYERISYPLLPTSLITLRTLCLNGCLLPFDYSCIGDLLNLEVLSLAKSHIRKLPSTFRNLKKLRLLDLSYCYNLVIDDGILENLARLEELYMSVHDEDDIHFNYNDVTGLSKNLYALEVGFFENEPQLEFMLFEKLERFKILVGRPLWKKAMDIAWESDKDTSSYRNTLMLVTPKDSLHESKMNKLIEKTEHLYLEIDGMKDLEDVDVHPSPVSSFFCNLRFLVVAECGKLRYLFTLNVAMALSRLETLMIAKCPVIESIIHIEGNGADIIKFPKLMGLDLDDLPKLSGLCNNVNLIQLPHLMELKLSGLPKITSIYPENVLATSCNISAIQPFFNKEFFIPRLKRIKVSKCDSLVNILPNNPMSLLCHLEVLEVDGCASIETLFDINVESVSKIEDGGSVIKEIDVSNCEGLVSLFPSNPMPLLRHLERLVISNCASIETLFDIDMDTVPTTKDGSSMLRRIEADNLEKLRQIWRVKGLNNRNVVIVGFQAVESISISGCKSFENVFTPANANFNMRALMDIEIVKSGECKRNNEVVKSTQEPEIDVTFPLHVMHNFHHLHSLILRVCKGVEVVFQVESGSSKELARIDQQPPLLLLYLKDIQLSYMWNMTHVWKCNWNGLLILQKQPELPFRCLTTLRLYECPKIKYLFSPLMAKLLSNLKEINMEQCSCIEEVVSSMDDNDKEMADSPSSSSSSTETITTLFPRLDSLSLGFLENLKSIGGSGVGSKGGRNDPFKVSQHGVVPWSLCQYSRVIEIYECDKLSHVIPSYALGHMQKLEVLEIEYCSSMIEVFETQGINNIVGGNSNNVAEGSSGIDPTLESPRLENINIPQLLQLKKVNIVGCDLLQHVFPFSALESLRQLEKLKISECEAMKVIVKEENGEQTKEAVFPHLKSIKLFHLPNLEGFFLGMNDFLWKSLEFIMIYDCPRIRLFTAGQSTTPKLYFIHTSLGKQSLEHSLNFHVTTYLYQTQCPSLDGTNLCSATSEGKPLSFHNTVEVDVFWENDIKHIIPSNELPQLQKLEKVRVRCCNSVEEVFEIALEGTNCGFNESSTTIEIPNLREVELGYLRKLKYIWKSNRWTTLQFPNLTKLSISECGELKHVFTYSMVGSISQLQELHLFSCDGLEVIVKEEEECDGNEITLPCLKSLQLEWLSSLEGFCLGKEACSLPLLDTLHIEDCPALTVFTKGHLTTPKLNVMTRDLNSVIDTIRQEGLQF